MTQPTEKQVKYYYFLVNKFKREHMGFTPQIIKEMFNTIELWNRAIEKGTMTTQQISGAIKVLQEYDKSTIELM